MSLIEGAAFNPTGTNEITEVIDEAWTNIQIDSQIFSTFLSCHRKADYVFNRHLVPISGVPKSFEKGQVVHIGIHAYWKGRISGLNYQESSLLGVDTAKKESLKFKNLNQEDSLDAFGTLVQFFQHIQSLNWTPIATEQHFRFKAYEDFKLKLRIYLTGRIDLIMRAPNGKLIPIDNKSESQRWFYSQMSNQFKIYALACDSNILGVQRIGFQETVKAEEKFKMEIVSFDSDILEEWRTETLPYWCKQLLLCKEENFWPMNTTSCIQGNFSCQFSDKQDHKGICSVSREVREQKLMRYFTVGEAWDPGTF